MVYWNICYQVSSLCCPHQPCRVTSEHSSSAPILDVNYEYPPMKQQMWLLFFWNFFNILKTWPQSVFFKFHQRFFFILRFPFYWKFNIDVRYTLYIFVYLNYFLNIGGDWLWVGVDVDYLETSNWWLWLPSSSSSPWLALERTTSSWASLCPTPGETPRRRRDIGRR